jgi:hypothetical protein
MSTSGTILSQEGEALAKHHDPAVHALREGMDRIGIWWGFAAFGGVAAMLRALDEVAAGRKSYCNPSLALHNGHGRLDGSARAARPRTRLTRSA